MIKKKKKARLLGLNDRHLLLTVLYGDKSGIKVLEDLMFTESCMGWLHFKLQLNCFEMVLSIEM